MRRVVAFTVLALFSTRVALAQVALPPTAPIQPSGGAIATSAVAAESVDWREFVTPTGVSAPTRLAFDGEHIVGLETRLDSDRTETWLWKGNLWEIRQVSPPKRQKFALSEFENGVVLFGGVVNGPDFDQDYYTNDTWVWDGESWRRALSPRSPSPRENPAMAPYGSGVLLFGGFCLGNPAMPPCPKPGRLLDTWFWDGAEWIEIDTDDAPIDNTTPMMASMDDDMVVLMVDWSPAENGWGTWTGNSWEQVVASAPSGSGWMVGLGDEILFFGGHQRTGGGPGSPPSIQYHNETWLLEGVTWVKRTPATSPPVRDDWALARIGTQAFLSAPGELVWRWDGSTWSQVPEAAPPILSESALTATSSKVILFGGIGDLGASNEAWEWDPLSSSWSLLSPPASPSGRYFHAMATTDAGLLLFSGRSLTTVLSDTWLFQEAGWTEQSSVANPLGSTNIVMATDGGGALLERSGATWQWSGGQWSEYTGSPSPSSRAATAMAEGVGHVVLFGGHASGNKLQDTWVWNGTGWEFRTPSNSPPPRSGQGMAGNGERVLLFGGGSQDNLLLYDTWSWDGANWTELQSNDPPRAAVQQLLAAEPGGTYLMHGGPATYRAVIKSGSVLGVACTNATQCLSGYCIDGACCDGPCGGGDPTDCFACSVAGGATVAGTCVVRQDGSACTDFNDCTPNDQCVVGVCRGDFVDDSDNDGTLDCNDGCPNDPAKNDPGGCGCGVEDVDTDVDAVLDCDDGCPGDAEKALPGACGCGVADVDTDSDGTLDCNDGCPNDGAKTAPGACGCGIADNDTDSDGVLDCNDGCDSDPEKIEPGLCGCGMPDVDTDADGVASCNEGCDLDPDKTSPGECGCGIADLDSNLDGTADCNQGPCENSTDDRDADGTLDCNDACPDDSNKVTPGVCGCGLSDIDSDGDGTADCNDRCSEDALKVGPGACGCGEPDTDDNQNGLIDCNEGPCGESPDSDFDGVLDCHDGCPSDAAKATPGTCGCGVSDIDSDGDGTRDCVDGCVNDANKIASGECGCGVSDIDFDEDSAPDCIDGCPDDAMKIAPGECGCGVEDMDTDQDGTLDCQDGCPDDPNKLAPISCGCGIPDADADGDGTLDCSDECPMDVGKVLPGVCGCGIADTDDDADGTLDCKDECTDDPRKTDPGACGCGVDDVDSDGDGVFDCEDQCPDDPEKTAPGMCGCGVEDELGVDDCSEATDGGPVVYDGGDLDAGAHALAPAASDAAATRGPPTADTGDAGAVATGPATSVVDAGPVELEDTEPLPDAGLAHAREERRSDSENTAPLEVGAGGCGCTVPGGPPMSRGFVPWLLLVLALRLRRKCSY